MRNSFFRNIFLLTLISFSSQFLSAQTIIIKANAPFSVVLGDTLDLSIALSDIPAGNQVFATRWMLHWSPSSISYTGNITWNRFFGQNEQTFGYRIPGQNTLDMSVSAVSNGERATAGVLARVRFVATATGNVTFSLSKVALQDASGNSLQVQGSGSATKIFPTPPRISALSATSVKKGDVVTVTGSNFPTNLSDVRVLVGSISASVRSVSATEITFEVPAGFSNNPVVVINRLTGQWGRSARSLLMTFESYDASAAKISSSNFNSSGASGSGVSVTSLFNVDFNNDGKLDLLYATQRSLFYQLNKTLPGSIYESMDVTTLGFSNPNANWGDSNPVATFSDVTGDQFPESIIGFHDGKLFIAPNHLAPTYENSDESPAGVYSFSSRFKQLLVHDFSRDGLNDLLVLSQNDSLHFLQNSGNTADLNTLFFRAGSIAFTSSSNFIAAEDVTGDSEFELLLLKAGQLQLFKPLIRPEFPFYDFSASLLSSTTFSGTGITDVVVADLNNDGRPDLFSRGEVYRTHIQNGLGGALSFATRSFNITDSYGYLGAGDRITTADLNGDQKPEVLVASGSLHLFQNRTRHPHPDSIRFETVDLTNLINSSSSSLKVVSGDFNLDGRIDLVTATEYSSRVNLNRIADPVTQFSYNKKPDIVYRGMQQPPKRVQVKVKYLTGDVVISTLNQQVEFRSAENQPFVDSLAIVIPSDSIFSFSTAFEVRHKLVRPMSTPYVILKKNGNSIGGVVFEDNIEVNRPAEIDAFSPMEGSFGTEVRIQGRYFNVEPTVKFGNIRAQNISATDSVIRVIVPVGALSGPISVSFPFGSNVGHTAKSPKDFRVLSTGNFPDLADPASFLADTLRGFGKSANLIWNDYNNDRRIDFYSISTEGSTGLYVFGRNALLGNPNLQTFNPQATSWAPSSSFLGDDVNIDGHIDFFGVLTTNGNTSVLFYRNYGTSYYGGGSFYFDNSSVVPLPRPVQRMRLTDINDDGTQDLLFLELDTLRVMLNKPGRSYDERVVFVKNGEVVQYLGGSGFSDLFLEEVSGDLYHDAILVNKSGSFIEVRNGMPTPLNYTTPFFGNATRIDTKGQPEKVVLVDMNGDGIKDIVYANSANQIVFLFNRTASETVAFEEVYTLTRENASPIFSLGDINNDGIPDMALGSSARKVDLFQNDVAFPATSVNMVFKQSIALSAPAKQIDVHDFNVDGKSDIAVVMNATNNSLLILNSLFSVSVEHNLQPFQAFVGLPSDVQSFVFKSGPGFLSSYAIRPQENVEYSFYPDRLFQNTPGFFSQDLPNTIFERRIYIRIPVWAPLGAINSGIQITGPQFKTQFIPITGTVVRNTSAENTPEIPKELTLADNFPNPFNPTTTIRFGIPAAETVHIQIMDVNGRVVADTGAKRYTAGFHNLVVDAQSWSTGVYFYRIVSGSKTLTKKMMLLK